MKCPECLKYELEKYSPAMVWCPCCMMTFLKAEIGYGGGLSTGSLRPKVEGEKNMADEYEERQGGIFWKPENEGDATEGTLVAVRAGQYGDVYDLEQKDGSVVTIPTSAVLKNRLSSKDEGKYIRVVFDGLQQSKIKGRNPTRLFKVFIKK